MIFYILSQNTTLYLNYCTYILLLRRRASPGRRHGRSVATLRPRPSAPPPFDLNGRRMVSPLEAVFISYDATTGKAVDGLRPRPQLGRPPAGNRVRHLRFLGEFNRNSSRDCGTSCLDEMLLREKNLYRFLGGSLVLDFADDGSGSHECFIMVLVVLRDRAKSCFDRRMRNLRRN